MSGYIHNFSLATPSVKGKRTAIRLPHNVKTSISVGKLYPLPPIEVLPGDTWSAKITEVSRVTSAFLKPVMDNLFLDIYHFYVPLRLLMDNSDNVFGSADPSGWNTGPIGYFPTIQASQFPSGQNYFNIAEKSVGDYLGMPTGKVSNGWSILPFRAFARIWSEWFRNENVDYSCLVSKQNVVAASEIPNSNAWGPANYVGMCPPVAKIKDIFSSCLPSPQKGQPVSAYLAGLAPVVTSSTDHNPGSQALHWAGANSTPPYSHISVGGDLGLQSNGDTTYSGSTNAGTVDIAPSNLYADLTSASGFSINDLRFAWQLQKLLEVDARCGGRIGEYYLAHYHTYNPDSRIQYTEYIGGGRMPIGIQQVAQTSAQASPGDPTVGALGAFSLSNGFSSFRKATSEHGYIITCVCVRYTHSYSQMFHPLWFRKQRTDFYDPLFAHLGEQPIYKEFLFGTATGSDQYKKTVFGYNEYGAEYRYLPNTVTGEMRPGATNKLDLWSFADYYSSAPTLSGSFIHEEPAYVDRTLAVSQANQDAFMLDLYFDAKAVRVMPLYSVPGFVDH